MTLNIHYEGPAVKITQRNQEFFYVPIPSKKAADVLGHDTLTWAERDSTFAGFNREIDERHVAQILTGLRVEGSIIPNAIIVYILHENFQFERNPGPASTIEPGAARILSDPQNPSGPLGFVIDGQHRLEALSRLEFEQNEADIPVGFVIFQAPEDSEERTRFEQFVLTQMSIINLSKPLSDNERLLVQQRLRRVMREHPKKAENTANLIVMDLDANLHSPVKFSHGNKRAPSGQTWLTLSVWVTVLTEALQQQQILSRIFDSSFEEDPEKRAKTARVVDIYLQAVAGLIQDKGWWETPTRKQRLYHNVGLQVLTQLLDDANEHSSAVSMINPGKILSASDLLASRQFQKSLKPIRLLDWSVGILTEATTDEDLVQLKMSGIQKQKQIPHNLYKQLQSLLQTCRELQGNEDPKTAIEYRFEVRSSDGIPVCLQHLSISKSQLDEMDNAIDAGLYDWRRNV